MTHRVRPVRVLLVEDSPTDVRLMREAFADSGFPADLDVAEDGVVGIDRIRCRGPYKHAVRPDLVLLDLNLPRRCGREVLADIKGDPEFTSMPIVVLTSSRDAADIRSSYDLHANCYVVKPGNLDDFMEAVHTVQRFWLSLAELPQPAAPAA